MRTRYDLAVIGSGPAGQKAALTAAKMGRRVALIDREDGVGGVCIHTGTIPSKAMREAILHFSGFNERTVYGQSYAVKHRITMADLLYRCRHVMRCEVEVIRIQMEEAGVEVVYGTASFTGPNALRVESGGEATELAADHVLIAVGTEPARPPAVPFAPGRVVDSNELLLLPELPRTMVIVGGGVIGTEYASMLATAGVRVTLVDARPRLLEFLDDELSESLQHRLRDRGISLRLGEEVAEIRLEDDEVRATLKSNKVLRAQTLLFAVGRQGCTDRLHLGAAGIAADSRGRISVNEHFQTSAPHIYAAGDVIGFPALAATSMEQGRLAACYMFRQIAEPSQTLYPLGIYTIPEISTVGQTERQLTEQALPYEVGIARYREVARGQLIADPHGLLKLLFHRDSRRLLGVHAIGTGATELIHIGQAVMAAGMPIDYFVDTVFNYPTLAEAYKVAAMDGLDRLRGAVGPSARPAAPLAEAA